MGKALYRKHRPKKLSEVIGQPHVTDTLVKALKSGSISHAYLLTGPRGVGKTSIARILAHEVNNLPYDEESSHLDIIEIDAASNRRIDEIRELKERVNIAPTSAKYKVYIVDEVHMLTKEAFNALLKTLEEPPEHVIFILATTEAHKVPETITSRTQRFSLKPIETAQVAMHLQSIALAEKLSISDEALELIAEHGEGSFRDSIGLLDQLQHSGGKTISLESVESTLGYAPAKLTDQLLSSLASGDIRGCHDALEQIFASGSQANQIASQLITKLRHQIVTDDTEASPSATLSLLRRLSEISVSANQRLGLELAIYEAALKISSPDTSPKTDTNHQATAKPAPITQPITTTSQKQSTSSTDEFGTDSWQEVLTKLKEKHNSLYSIVRIAKPVFSENTVTLSFGFAFHQKKVSDAKNLQILKNTMSDVLGRDANVICIVEKSDEPDQPQDIPATINLDTISNIFGGAEIVE